VAVVSPLAIVLALTMQPTITAHASSCTTTIAPYDGHIPGGSATYTITATAGTLYAATTFADTIDFWNAGQSTVYGRIPPASTTRTSTTFTFPASAYTVSNAYTAPQAGYVRAVCADGSYGNFMPFYYDTIDPTSGTTTTTTTTTTTVTTVTTVVTAEDSLASAAESAQLAAVTPCTYTTTSTTSSGAPTPASTPLACANQVTDPQELGSIQDTLVVIGSLVVLLLGGLLVAGLRR
jgi:hypothetical protein